MDILDQDVASWGGDEVCSYPLTRGLIDRLTHTSGQETTDRFPILRGPEMTDYPRLRLLAERYRYIRLPVSITAGIRVGPTNGRSPTEMLFLTESLSLSGAIS